MDPVYAQTINSFANDLDILWRDKNAFNSVKSHESVSIEDGNLCSYNRFMLSVSRGGDDVSVNSRNTNMNTQGWGPTSRPSMSLIDRLAKTASIWTLPDITRVESDKILHDFRPGTFMVRMTTNKKTMVLSYRMNDRSQHVMIKVDVLKGFHMDGSQHVFRNVNLLIAHYMKHPIQNPDLRLKLPRALMEAHEAMHFQFFENMKLNFWTTLLANKSIDDIWSKSTIENKPKESSVDTVTEVCPPVPPRVYHLNEVNILQGLADISDNADVDYQTIRGKYLKNRVPLPAPPISYSSLPCPEVKTAEENKNIGNEIYSQIWQWRSEENDNAISLPLPSVDELTTKESQSNVNSNLVDYSSLVRDNESISNYKESNKKQSYNSPNFTIAKIIEKYYPQLVNRKLECCPKGASCQSLSGDLLEKNKNLYDTSNNNFDVPKIKYETPWDLKNPLIGKLIEDDNDVTKVDDNSAENKNLPDKFGSLSHIPTYNSDTKSSMNELSIHDTKISRDSPETDDDEDELAENENRLQQEFLGEIESVMFSPTPDTQIYSSEKFRYGELIRDFLTRLCSQHGSSEISKSVRLFIKCTMDRHDLSPYTTMRLIRQYMSGLKNLITKNKQEFSLNHIINEEINYTPKNVFINLDSIIESVLTESVVKPLSAHVYRLLVLEHYKNNNLNLIADGVDRSASIDAEKLGIQPNAKSILDAKIDTIRRRFLMISKQYSPEKKIKYMISIVDIVFNMLSSIYPETDIGAMQLDIKSDNILPLFVYIFSQSKLDAISTQCEVEYVEGLIWSSKLVNGEPGFFLLNLMSALEAIKVLARPKVSSTDMINLTDKNAVKVNNSMFFTKIDPSSIYDAATGSVNVIIMDEKINRLVTKTFPVRSTVTVSSLCNTVAHRLGIFNPKDYNLYKFTGFDESLLSDHEYPLIIKQKHQQQTGESINFLFKRKNVNFILPCDVSAKK